MLYGMTLYFFNYFVAYSIKRLEHRDLKSGCQTLAAEKTATCKRLEDILEQDLELQQKTEIHQQKRNKRCNKCFINHCCEKQIAFPKEAQ